jgi:hypothetical protein
MRVPRASRRALVLVLLSSCSGASFSEADEAKKDAGSGGATGAGGSEAAGASGQGNTGGSASGGGGGDVADASEPPEDGALPDTSVPGLDGPVGLACKDPTDCPHSPCQVAACTANLCELRPVPAGPAPSQVRGDCRRVDCTAVGAESIVIDDTDSDDGNPCTKDACVGGVPSHAAAVGDSCGGGRRCSSTGACVGCEKDTDCPGVGVPECFQPACRNGSCTTGPKAPGALCNNSMDQCDGTGHCVDCVDNGGCGECCVCTPTHQCVATP